jgi:hypothetical protein
MHSNLPRKEERFIPDRFAGLILPYSALSWLLEQGRYEDALVYWCQENLLLDFYNTGWDLRPLERQLSSTKLVSLKIAHNAYLSKGMPDKLADLLLKLQREGRIVIGRERWENLELTVEPADDTPIHLLPVAHIEYPRRIAG